MSYQVLARKWRPQNFKEMVGQEHVLQALINALDTQRLHHAYLFTGTRGVGKTTIGRILAKCLSCETQVTSEPCGTCDACQSIAQGRYVDLIEIDAASRTKVEDMRELLENVQYAPSQGRFKIYLIDEVHMLSQSSFNALLKTLEEPPEHVKFLFATTDPQKLPVTILSRCLQFNLKNMSPEKIVSHLKFVLSQETVEFEEAALWALARAADGSMRDALSLTDQAIAYGDQVLSELGVSNMLGTVDQKKIYLILDALMAKNAALMMNEVKALSDFSPDYRSVLATLSSILHRVALEQVVPGSVDNAMGDQDKIQFYAQHVCAEDIQLFYQIALTSRQDLHITPDPKAGFEMALLRMLAFQMTPVSEGQKIPLSGSEVSNQINEEAGAESAVALDNVSPSGIESSARLAEQPPSDEEARNASNQELITQKSESPVTEQTETQTIESQAIESTVEVEKKSLNNMPNSLPDSAPNGHVSAEVVDKEFKEEFKEEAEKEANDSNEEPINKLSEQVQSDTDSSLVTNVDNEPQGWNADVIALGISGMTLNFMLNSVVELSAPTINVFVESGHFRLFNDNHEKRIREALLSYYDGCSEVVFLEGLRDNHETPMMWRERKLNEKKAHAKALIFQDPYVQEIVDVFQGNLIEQSIQPEG